MDSVIDENDKNTTEIARNEVAIAVKKAATVKRLKLLNSKNLFNEKLLLSLYYYLSTGEKRRMRS